tara:strand:+ start:1748 stop:1939 length:192 start_codon:yes stop_codon:yes gene_type:complete
MEPFSVLGIMIAIIIALFLGKIVSVALRVTFYFLLFALVMVFVFGVSYDELITVISEVILMVF